MYLQLVDRGVLTLETDMRPLFKPLGDASARVLTGFDEEGQPLFKPNSTPITLSQMLNQTSGFGKEFGEIVSGWKKVTTVGKGFVNSCKVVRVTQRVLWAEGA